MTVIDEKPLLIYLHFSDNTPAEEDQLELDGKKTDVIWKDVLVEGEYPLTPGAHGPIKRKLTVIAEGESSRENNIVAMSDLIASHEDGAFKYVTVPLKHRDEPMDNTGYVPRPGGVRIVTKDIEGEQKKVMQAALGFTEPDVKGKVQRGTIPDCSAGIFFDWRNKHKDKLYRSAMKHVALTPTPFMGNLNPFPAVFASDPDIDGDVQIQHFMFDDGSEESGDNSDAGKGEIVWHEHTASSFVRAAIDAQLNPKPQEAQEGFPTPEVAQYFTRDVSSDDTALVEEFHKGQQRKYVIPFVREGKEITVAPSTRWVEAREAMIAASDLPEFELVSSSCVQSLVADALATMFGDDVTKFNVKDVSVDQRAQIGNTDTGAEYVASFTLLADDSVVIEPPAQWERTKAPEQKVQSTNPPVVVSDDLTTPRGRVEAARKQRRLRSS